MTRWGRGLCALGLLLAACQADGQNKQGTPPASPPSRSPPVTDVTSEHYPAPTLPRAKVVLEDAFGSKHVVEVEVCATEAMRTRGMMWRTALPDGQGMLFIFGEEEVRSFWMRNTLIPLDMVFIASDGTVVGIVPNAEPRTLTSRGVGKPSQYVLEVPGGWTERMGIRPGKKAQLHGTAGIEVQP